MVYLVSVIVWLVSSAYCFACAEEYLRMQSIVFVCAQLFIHFGGISLRFRCIFDGLSHLTYTYNIQVYYPVSLSYVPHLTDIHNTSKNQTVHVGFCMVIGLYVFPHTCTEVWFYASPRTGSAPLFISGLGSSALSSQVRSALWQISTFLANANRTLQTATHADTCRRAAYNGTACAVCSRLYCFYAPRGTLCRAQKTKSRLQSYTNFLKYANFGHNYLLFATFAVHLRTHKCQ